MIINVKKYLLIGAKEELDSFFSKAQEKGIIEFIAPSGKKPFELPVEAQHLTHAIKILRKLPLKKPYEGPVEDHYACDVATQILDLKVSVGKLAEEKRLVEAEVFRVAPFGDFSLEDIDYIENEGKREIQFFCRKTAKRLLAELPESVFYIGTEYDLDYFIAVNSEITQYPDMIEMRIDRPLGELETHLSFIKESLHQLEAELKGFAGHIEVLQEELVEHLNEYHLIAAKKNVTYSMEDSIFAIEAWVPDNKVAALVSLIVGMAVHCEPILIEEKDRIPTQMENTGLKRIGEDLVQIYDVPAPTDKDPSSWVLFFLAFFSAMIVSDAGYGILFLAFVLYLKYKFPDLKGQGKRLIKLGAILSSACIVWGVLTASYFGIQIQPQNWISKVSALQYLAIQKADYHIAVKDDVYQDWITRFPNLSGSTGQEFVEQAIEQGPHGLKYAMLHTFSDNILLEFSLIVGIIHICLSLMRYVRRHLAGIGWIAFIIGGYFYFPFLLHATTIANFLGLVDKDTGTAIGLQLIYGGITLAILLALFQKRWKGIGEVSHVIQIFSDVLSYLRLYALGLAGTMMAETFNNMGEGIGLVAGALIILLGHSINISLGSMAIVVHGLRLNFIEWYHYSFEGGGRLFKPLIRLKFK